METTISSKFKKWMEFLKRQLFKSMCNKDRKIIKSTIFFNVEIIKTSK